MCTMGTCGDCGALDQVTGEWSYGLTEIESSEDVSMPIGEETEVGAAWSLGRESGA